MNRKEKIIKYLTLPLVLAGVIFYFVPSIFAQDPGNKVRLNQFLAGGGNLDTGKELAENGFAEIFYSFEGVKKVITNSNFTKSDPTTNNGYIVWTGQIDGMWQVFMHNALTESTIQLTKTGNNTNPRVSALGRVVWEAWVGDTWQIYLFDGTKIKQITQGDLAINADIEGDYIVFARKGNNGLWRSEAYSIKEDKTVLVDSGNETEYPKLEDGNILVGPPTVSQKRYPLKVGDLFLIDFAEFNLPTLSPTPALPTDSISEAPESTAATESAELE